MPKQPPCFDKTQQSLTSKENEPCPVFVALGLETTEKRQRQRLLLESNQKMMRKFLTYKLSKNICK
jgi:hypothetical protein